MRDRPVLSEGIGGSLPESQAEFGYPLVLVGGFPCQDLSVAGKQAGLTGTRSGLWQEFRRAINEVRPDWIVIENVAHTWRRWVPSVRRDLWVSGYDSLPLRVRASDLGAPHERSRIFIVANADCELLRKLSRWWCGAGRKMANEFASDGGKKQMADAAGDRRKQKRSNSRRSDSGDSSQGHHGSRSVCSRGWWASEPGVGRVADGVPNRVDRLKSIGNSVVPQIPQIIARGIKEVTEIKTLSERVAFLEEVIRAPLALVKKQANDEGLWSVPMGRLQSIAEAHLQAELRKLHYAIECNAHEAGITCPDGT